VVKAFAAEDPQNWFVKLTPEAYFVLREALAPAYLQYLERAREWAASRERALSILANRHGRVDIPKKVKERAAERARAVLERYAANFVKWYGEERAQAALVKIAVLLEEWVREGELPNAHAEILKAMWAWEGEERPSRVEREWGFWLFREHFSELKKAADALGVDVMHLWNAYRAALERYLATVFAYGGLVERAVTTVDKALYTTLVAAGGVALAEALQGVVRPEIVYTVSSAASLALAGRYREAIDVVKTAVHNVELAVRRIAGEVKVALERLYEAIVEAVARLLQWLGEHWRVLALVTAAVAAGVLTWIAAQQVLADVDVSQFAKLAAGGFFGLAGVREDKRAAREGLREAVERVRKLQGQAAKHSPLFGEWEPPEGAKEAGRDLAVKVLYHVGHKGLDKGVEGKIVEQSRAFKARRGRVAAEDEVVAFDALKDVKVAGAAGEAATAIRRVVEEAKAAVRPVVAIASKALVEVGKRLANEREWERFVDVGLADAEFKEAFNVAGRPPYFVYSVGDVEFGAVKAKGVKAVAFISGEKTLRIEILAEGVEGLAAEARE